MARLEDVLLQNVGFKVAALEKIVGEGTWFWNYFLKPVFGSLPQIRNIERAFSDIPKDEAKKELLKLGSQIALLRDSIVKEPIYELEKIYVLNKKSMVLMFDTLAAQIERKLLLFREKGTLMSQQTKQLIKHALALPTKHLKLSNDKLQLISSNSFLKNFDPELLNKLKLIAHKFIVDSNQPDDRGSNNRGVYYFHGDPGTGKSRSAVELLTLLGLPFFIPPIRDIKDLSCQNLEGQESAPGKNNAGIFVKTLLARNNTDGAPYLNAVLIFDDFDRVLFAQDQKTGTPSALSFLLDYLDPSKKSYFNPYFNAYLDISRLSIIITANKPIPKVKQTLTGSVEDDPYTALRSRVTQVFFPNFLDQALKTILRPIAESLMEKYSFTPENYAPMPKDQFIIYLIEDAIAKQKKISSVLEPRDMTRQLELIISAKKLNINLKDDVPEQESKDYSETLKALEAQFSALSEEFNAYKKGVQAKQSTPTQSSSDTSMVYSSLVPQPLPESSVVASTLPNTGLKKSMASQ